MSFSSRFTYGFTRATTAVSRSGEDESLIKISFVSIQQTAMTSTSGRANDRQQRSNAFKVHLLFRVYLFLSNRSITVGKYLRCSKINDTMRFLSFLVTQHRSKNVKMLSHFNIKRATG